MVSIYQHPVVRANSRASVTQIANKVNADSERKVSEHGASQFAAYGAAQLLTNQGAYADPSPARSANSGHVIIGTGPWTNGRRWPDVMQHVFFYIMWLPRCVCIAHLGNMWHQDGLWDKGGRFSLMAVAS